jgi:selenocysteine lyase/cysteine desulfurase
MVEFPVERVRRMFPALQRSASSVFFDNAAGAQIPQKVFDAINDHLLSRNVQRGGRYRESREVDAEIARAREVVATFLNASEPEEVAFGMNATSFIRLVSLALSQTFAERREIIVSDLDHEANIATWMALEQAGAVIRWWKVREDGHLHVGDLEPLLSAKTRLVACTVTSNAVGTIIDVAGVAQRAHAAGAEVFLDSFTTRHMVPSMYRNGAAITWCAQVTKFLLRIWGFSGDAAPHSTLYLPFGKNSSPTFRR